MILTFKPDVRRRLVEIEAAEGIPQTELVHQAVELWTMLDRDGRRAIGLAAMSMALKQIRPAGT
ncbi:hypothetical protein [Aureimonas mangrovi]|uniref:hypothetical protein n=1 Tax=Aureimonas mangrovi TaxID=2758041 RepID=UPI00163D55EC|nr:hypothetical protein [Aureimonas mangrovi]